MHPTQHGQLVQALVTSVEGGHNHAKDVRKDLYRLTLATFIAMQIHARKVGRR